MNTLLEFANWFKLNRFPHSATAMKRVYVTDTSTSTLVYNKFPFTAELYLLHPGVDVIPHSHPCDQLTIFISGSLLGSRNGITGSWLTSANHGQLGQINTAKDTHSFNCGQTGAVTYVLSMWEQVDQMESATLRYLGPAMGPIHKQLLAQEQSSM
jgi:hypothetical protein